MAIATPVLERKVENEKSVEQTENAYRNTYMSSEELHNARIKDNYARLINPEYKIEDLFDNAIYGNKQSEVNSQSATLVDVPQQVSAPQQAYAPQQMAMPQQTVAPQKPYLVENARADAAIFRADNPVNQVASQATATKNEDEENEDLRPTDTTIQYKTVKMASQNTARRTEIKVNEDEDAPKLTKRDKVIIGVFVAIVVSLFVLVVVNSAIIAGLNADISALSANLTTVKGTLAGVNSEVNSLLTPEAIDDFAKLHGLVIK
jgi:cell division protein FtsL